MPLDTRAQAIAQMRILARENSYYFSKAVAGYKRLEPIHRAMCEHLTTPNVRQKGLMAPRGTYKSSVVKGCVLWYIANNPNARVLYVCKTMSGASAALQDMMQRLLGKDAPLMKVLYSSAIPENPRATGQQWSSLGFTLNRTRAFDESTVEAAGIGSNKIRRHYDIIVCDDIQAPDKDELTEDEVILRPDDIARCLGWLQAMDGLFDPEGPKELWYVTTRWANNDCTGWLQRSWTDMKWLSIPVEHKGELLFPKQYPRERIEELRGRLSSYFFQAQMYNSAIDAVNKPFHKEHLQYFTKTPNRSTLFTALVVDPARGASKGNVAKSKTALNVCGAKSGLIYDLEYVYDNLSLVPTVNRALDLAEKWDVDLIAYEDVAYQESFEDYLRKAMQERGLKRWKVLPIKRSSASKANRLTVLRLHLENRDIYIRPGMRELEQEFDLYTGHEGDKADLLDTLADFVRLARANNSLIAVPGSRAANDAELAERGAELDLATAKSVKIGVFVTEPKPGELAEMGIAVVALDREDNAYLIRAFSGMLSTPELVANLSKVMFGVPEDNVQVVCPKDIKTILRDGLPYRVRAVPTSPADLFRVGMLGEALAQGKILLSPGHADELTKLLHTTVSVPRALELATRRGGGALGSAVVDSPSESTTQQIGETTHWSSKFFAPRTINSHEVELEHIGRN